MDPTSAHGFVHELDPVLIRLGPLQIRYYGILFVTTILVGYRFWIWQMRRGGYSRELAERFLTWGVLGVIVGARLGHCFFYRADYFLAHPLEILFFWKGGLASHGATLGLVMVLILYARVNKLGLIDLMDRFSFSAAVGAAGIRLGNFLNSEIVGRATELPWAVRFVYYDGGEVARHPSQLYEFALGLFVLTVLVLADRWADRERRPVGLITGLFFTVYFLGRFMVEFVKEYHTLQDSLLTMGQYLSIVPFLVGVGLLFWSLRAKKRSDTQRQEPQSLDAQQVQDKRDSFD